MLFILYKLVVLCGFFLFRCSSTSNLTCDHNVIQVFFLDPVDQKNQPKVDYKEIGPRRFCDSMGFFK